MDANCRDGWIQAIDQNFVCRECGAIYDQPVTHDCANNKPKPGYYHSFCYTAMILLIHISWAVTRPASGKREDDLAITRADKWLKDNA